MKSNGLLKWLMIPFVLLAVFIGIKLLSPSDQASTTSPGTELTGNALTAAEMKALDIDGDTPKDTVATLVAQVKALRGELKTALEDNKQQKTENERLRLRDSAIDQRIQNAITAERNRSRQDRDRTSIEQQQTQGLIEDLRRKLESAGGKPSHADLPVGLGLTDADADALDTDAVRWVEPQDAQPPGDKKSSSRRSSSTGESQFPTSFGSAADRASESLESTSDGITDYMEIGRASCRERV